MTSSRIDNQPYLSDATIGTMDTPTTTPWLQGLLPQQQHSLGNCEQTCVEPIDWDAILAPREPPTTPQTVRKYLAQIVHNMNAHFAIHMSGPSIGRIQVERTSRFSPKKDVVLLSPWRAEQLFPRKVTCRWRENLKERVLFKSAFDIWLSSSQRREIRPTNTIRHPVYLWLKTQVGMPKECSLIEYGRLNYRKPLYESFLASVRNPTDWPHKRFWQSLYSILKDSRPARNRRIRFKGRAAVWLPTRDDILEHLGAFSASESAQLRF